MSAVSSLKKFESNQVFNESEAWTLFKLAAIGEAIGWTLLITGLALKRFVVHGNNLPVLLAGRVHGVLFLLYALAGLGLYPNLRWSRRRALVATIASVPPYGSLLFEQWASYRRKNSRLKTYSRSLLLSMLATPDPGK